MKKYLVVLLLMVSVFAAWAEKPAVADVWSEQTAYLVPKGSWETGLIQSFRYGLSDKIELRGNILLEPLLPNLELKYALGEKNGWTFASLHALSYPTLFLSTLSLKGIGGFISPEYTFKPIVSVGNSLWMTRTLGTTSLLNANAGVYFALRGGRPDPQSTIDLPLLYPRMAHWYEGASLRLGGSFRTSITDRLFVEEFLRGFFITRADDNLFLENGTGLCWAVGRSLRIKAGYVLTWGKYPFGNHWQFCPSFDLIFGTPVR